MSKLVDKSNDEIREMILKLFYDVHKKAYSPKRMRLKISDFKRKFKNSGIKSSDLLNNLDYLVQTGFIVKEEDTRQITTSKGTFPSKTVYYKASHTTMDYFDGISKFQKVDKSISRVDVTNIQGVTNIISGDSNVIINSQYVDLYKNLDLLSDVVLKSGSLGNEEKLNYIGEINTIKAQLGKTNPDRSIIKKAWEKLQPLAAVAGIGSFFIKVAELIMRLTA
ncbi:hypothetical protein HXY32_00185 [Candidatus Bathyarchaeota archaeon]|nr:hypothetical protein [Candidatus Bathyarchaeota archaeon]